jgi:protein phosphatase
LHHYEAVHKKVLSQLLHPRLWEPNADRRFMLTAKEIDELCTLAEEKFMAEPTVGAVQVEESI